MSTLSLKAPKATAVKNVLSASDIVVEEGTPLIELQDYEEQMALSKLARDKADNLSRLQEVTGPKVAEKRALYTQLLSETGDAHESTSKYLEIIEAMVQSGIESPNEVPRASRDVVIKAYQMLQIGIEQEVYARNCADAEVIHRMIDGIFQKEISYVERSAARLRIKAPRRGIFRCFVDVASPIRIGHLLGEIIPD